MLVWGSTPRREKAEAQLVERVSLEREIWIQIGQDRTLQQDTMSPRPSLKEAGEVAQRTGRRPLPSLPSATEEQTSQACGLVTSHRCSGAITDLETERASEVLSPGVATIEHVQHHATAAPDVHLGIAGLPHHHFWGHVCLCTRNVVP